MLWVIVICLLISFTMSFYDTFIQNQKQILGMVSLVPAGILKFRGISNITDMLSVLGFYSANNIIYMMVLGSIFSIVLASNILLKEEYNKTAEFLLSKPLTRGEIFFTKCAVLTLNILLLNIIAASVGIISIECVKMGNYNIKSYFVLTFYTLLLNFLFGSIGLFVSTLIKRPKPITTFSIAIVLILYFTYTISRITESADKFGYVSPFKFINVSVLEPSYGIDFWRVSYFIGGSLILTTISYFIYKRKNIVT